MHDEPGTELISPLYATRPATSNCSAAVSPPSSICLCADSCPHAYAPHSKPPRPPRNARRHRRQERHLVLVGGAMTVEGTSVGPDSHAVNRPDSRNAGAREQAAFVNIFASANNFVGLRFVRRRRQVRQRDALRSRRIPLMPIAGAFSARRRSINNCREPKRPCRIHTAALQRQKPGSGRTRSFDLLRSTSA
jgi:hypothetical protein